MTLEEINALREQIKAAKHLTENELFDFARKANEERKRYKIAIKLKDECYQKWYLESINRYPDIFKESLSDETLYITSTDNKAFIPGMGGYSIFGISIAMMLRTARGIVQDMIDRIEHQPIEYGVILEETK